MTLKALFLRIILIFIGILIFFFIFFFFGSLTKFKSLADKFPYSEIVNKELKTQVVCYVCLNEENRTTKNPYRLEMDLKQVYVDRSNIYKIPVGTILNIEDAKSATRPVSGATHKLVFGTVFIKELNKKVAFEFYWGENPTHGLYDHDENYDIYDLAPWQKTALPYKYFWNGTTKPHDWQAWRE